TLSRDGGEQYVFDVDGRHTETKDPLTGDTKLTFAYDEAGRLTRIEDADGNRVTIMHGTGQIVVTAPLGQTTTLVLNGDGNVSSIINPAGETTQLSYGDGGLLASLSDPLRGTSTFDYDADGLLERDTSPGGGFQDFGQTVAPADT